MMAGSYPRPAQGMMPGVAPAAAQAYGRVMQASPSAAPPQPTVSLSASMPAACFQQAKPAQMQSVASARGSTPFVQRPGGGAVQVGGYPQPPAQQAPQPTPQVATRAPGPSPRYAGKSHSPTRLQVSAASAHSPGAASAQSPGQRSQWSPPRGRKTGVAFGDRVSIDPSGQVGLARPVERLSTVSPPLPVAQPVPQPVQPAPQPVQGMVVRSNFPGVQQPQAVQSPQVSPIQPQQPQPQQLQPQPLRRPSYVQVQQQQPQLPMQQMQPPLQAQQQQQQQHQLQMQQQVMVQPKTQDPAFSRAASARRSVVMPNGALQRMSLVGGPSDAAEWWQDESIDEEQKRAAMAMAHKISQRRR
uniref:Uncharacterized protein n=1 Tax=Alexandrium monilatum TaxID=311494 RepID=A0A7S4RJI4_9DINO